MSVTDDTFRVTAIVAAYNEADVIGQVIGDLIQQGVSVYLIDDGSTDETVGEAERFLGRGLLEIERLPPSDGRFDWSRILRRKEELAQTLDATWFVHADADELRESPWGDRTLGEGIRLVDRLGFNAIDFAVFNFRPTNDRFARGQDLREAFPFYEPGQRFDQLQLKCWKKQPTSVDLVSTGGHEVQFAKRRVFPVRFLLRHYPLRSQAHAERKIFEERLPRFVATERSRGWHVQYDGLDRGHRFCRAPEELLRFDADAVRATLQLRHRTVEALEEELTQARDESSARSQALAQSQDELARARAELDAHRRALSHKEDELKRAHAELVANDRLLAQLHEELGRERAALVQASAATESTRHQLESVQAEHASLLASRTWRWTSAARRAWRLLGRR
jgi:glycosyltransferase involved in cell wall biosynthesis